MENTDEKFDKILEENLSSKNEKTQHQIDVEKRKEAFEKFSSLQKFKVYFIEGFIISSKPRSKHSDSDDDADQDKKHSIGLGGNMNNVLPLSLIIFPIFSFMKLLPKGSAELLKIDVMFFILFNLAMFIGGIVVFPYLGKKAKEELYKHDFKEREKFFLSKLPVPLIGAIFFSMLFARRI